MNTKINTTEQETLIETHAEDNAQPAIGQKVRARVGMKVQSHIKGGPIYMSGATLQG